MTAPRIELEDFYIPDPRPVNCVGYAKIRLPDVGIILHGLSVFQNTREAWANMPVRMCNLGKRHRLITFDLRAEYFDFSNRVVDLVRTAHPEAFTEHPNNPATNI